MHDVAHELSNLALGDDELELAKEATDGVLVGAEEHGSEVVAVHEDVDGGGEGGSEEGVGAGESVVDGEGVPDNAAVVEDVEEGDLAVVVLEHHQDGVNVLRELGAQENPEELGHAPIVGNITGTISDVVVDELVSVAGDGGGSNADGHVEGEPEQDEVVHNTKGTVATLTDDLSDDEGKDDQSEVDNGGEEDGLELGQGNAGSEGVLVGGEGLLHPTHTVEQGAGDGGVGLGDSGVAEHVLAVDCGVGLVNRLENIHGGGADGVHNGVGDLEGGGDLVGQAIHDLLGWEVGKDRIHCLLGGLTI